MPSSGVQTSARSEEHTSELQSHDNLVCRLLLEKKPEDPMLPNGTGAAREPLAGRFHAGGVRGGGWGPRTPQVGQPRERHRHFVKFFFYEAAPPGLSPYSPSAAPPD